MSLPDPSKFLSRQNEVDPSALMSLKILLLNANKVGLSCKLLNYPFLILLTLLRILSTGKMSPCYSELIHIVCQPVIIQNFRINVFQQFVRLVL